MRIENNEITITTGNKKTIYKNLIMDAYLKKFRDAQLVSPAESRALKYSRSLEYILLKFDTNLDFNVETDVYNRDFDVCIIFDSRKVNQTIYKNKVEINYIYNSSGEINNIIDYATGTTKRLADYVGRKITAIGFNTYFLPTNPTVIPVCAILDTSNYNLYIMDSEKLSFSRKDTISSDAEFYTEDEIEGATHLAAKAIIGETDALCTQLVAFGFTNEKNVIQDRYVVNGNYELVDTSIIFNEVENAFNDNIKYASESIVASNNVYCDRENFKYISFEYDSFLLRNGIYEYKGKYFMLIPIKEYGNTILKIDYERS